MARAAERPCIVAMTANALQADRELCLAAGMDDYIAKPMRLAELGQALARCPPRAAAAAPAPAGGAARDTGLASPQSPAIRAAPAIDSVMYRQLQPDTGGASFVVGLVDTFAEEVLPLVAELRSAFAEGADERFKSAANALKSGARTFDALPLAERALALGHGSPPAGAEPIDVLADELQRCLAALRKLARG